VIGGQGRGAHRGPARPSRSRAGETSRASTPSRVQGEITGLTGVDDLYEAPLRPTPGRGGRTPGRCTERGAGERAYYLAYRMRAPLGQGRGMSNVVARSSDGVHFDTVAVVTKDRFGVESLERPALVHTPEGRWRLYLRAPSCPATHDTG
jgi:hypothetical protein